MMRMITAFARFWWPVTCQGYTISVNQWVKNGLGKCRRPDIGSERLAINRDVNAALRFVRFYLYTLRRRTCESIWHQQNTCSKHSQEGSPIHRPYLPPSPAVFFH